MEIVESISCRPIRRLSDLSDSSTNHGDPEIRKRQKTAPKFEPWNQVSFFRRAKTFSRLNWFSMPVELSPLQCARYGWQCVGRNLMSCECCSANLCINFSDSNLIDVKALTRHYTSQLAKAHQQECVWRDNGCPQSFVSLPDDPVMLRGVFRENFTTWVSRNKFIETGVYTYPILHPATRCLLLKCWRKDEDSSNMTPSDLILLAACGWQLRKFDPLKESDGPSGIWVMECSYCVRQVSLKSLDVTTTRKTSITQSSWQEETKETENPSVFYPTNNLFPTDELREPMLFGRPDNAGIMGWGLHEWSSRLEQTQFPRRGLKRPRSVPDISEHVSPVRNTRQVLASPLNPSDISRKRPREILAEEGAALVFQKRSPQKKLKRTVGMTDQDDEKLPSRPKRPLPIEGDYPENRSPSAKKLRTLSPPKKREDVLPGQAKKRHLPDDCNNISMDGNQSVESFNINRNKRFRLASAFHPLEEHTYSCPYVLKKRGKAGWTRVIRALPADPLYYEVSP